MNESGIPLSLPKQCTKFIGRQETLREIETLFKSASRLVTLTGAGGIGKTRLAIEVAKQVRPLFPGGVFMVEFAIINDPFSISSHVAGSLGLDVHGGENLTTTVNHRFTMPVLLVFDNCEHLIDACSHSVTDLVLNTDVVSVLATSREALAAPGEIIWPLSPLQIPLSRGDVDYEQCHELESVQLFVDRARLQIPEFQLTQDNVASVSEICRRVDGIPLAIELAAARVRALSPNDILMKLTDRFKLLKRNHRAALPRQQTLKALIDWSYDLLNEREQLLWQRLSVFNPGFSLEDVEVVVTDERLPYDEVVDSITRLVDKSIVIASVEQNLTRYRMLESIREYGLHRLKELGQEETYRKRHKEYYTSLMRNLIDVYYAEPDGLVLMMSALSRVVDNVTEALFYGQPLTDTDSMETASMLCLLAVYYYAYGERAFGYKVMKQALIMPESTKQVLDRVLSLVSEGFLTVTLEPEGSVFAREAFRIVQICHNLFVSELSLSELTKALSSHSTIRAIGELLILSTHWMRGSIGHVLLALYFILQEDEKMARHHAILAVQTGEGHKNTYYYSLAMGNLGIIELATGHAEQAVSFLEKAVVYMDANQNYVNLYEFLLPLSRAYQLIDRERETILYLLKAMTIQIEFEFTHMPVLWSFLICSGMGLDRLSVYALHLVSDELSHTDLPNYLRNACRPAITKLNTMVENTSKLTVNSTFRPNHRNWFKMVIDELNIRVSQLNSNDTLQSKDDFALTKRELEVLQLLAKGHANKEIANQLYLTMGTVRTYLSRIYGKLGVHSRTEALLHARSSSLIDS